MCIIRRGCGGCRRTAGAAGALPGIASAGAAAGKAELVKVIEVGCPYCPEVRRKDRLTRDGIRMAMTAYVAHLVESHWDMLEEGRRMRLATGRAIDDSWTRL